MRYRDGPSGPIATAGGAVISPRLLVEAFTQNHPAIRVQLDGVGHEESLRQPPFSGNCINWVVGHIVVARTNILYPLGARSVWSRAEIMRYVPGSPPITADDQALRFAAILDELDRTQAQIAAALGRTPPEALDRIVGEKPLGEEIHDYAIHEARHVAQLDILRPLVGA